MGGVYWLRELCLGDNGVAAVEKAIERRSAQELLSDFHRTGEQSPFAEIVRRYGAMVYAHCLRVTKNRHDAEDAAQAVFLTLASQRNAGRAEIRMLGPWLQQVAYRVSLDMRRSRKRRVAREERMARLRKAEGEPENDPVGASHSLELSSLLRQELDALPAKFRLPMILHYYGGMSREEMARELKCKVSTLGVRLFRGRQMLGKRLAKRGVVLSTGVVAMALARAVQETIGGAMVAETARAAAAARLAGDAVQIGGVTAAQLASWAHPSLLAANGMRLKWPLLAVLLAGSALSTTAVVVGQVDPSIIWPTIQHRLQQFLQPIVQPLFRSADVPVLVSDAAKAEMRAPVVWAAPDPYGYDYGGFLPLASAPPAQTSRPAAPTRVLPPPSPAAPAGSPVAALQATVASADRSGSAQARATMRVPVVVPPLRPEASAALPPPREVPSMAPADGGAASASTGAGGGSGTWAPSSIHLARPPASPGPALTASRTYRAPAPPVVWRRPQEPSDVPGAPDVAAIPDASTASNPTAPPVAPPIRTGAAPVHLALAPVAPPEPVQLPGGVVIYANSAAAADQIGSMRAQADPVFLNVTAAGGYVFSSSQQYVSLPQSQDSGVFSPPTYRVTATTLRGYGAPHVTGELTQNGQVVADGGGADRTLDLSRVQRIANTADNPAEAGLNGWYALNRGKLRLPSMIRIEQGGPVITWGEDPTDPVLDLVNSVRLSGFAATPSEPVVLSLLSPDRSDVPAGLLRGRMIGLWSIDAEAGLGGAVDVAIRYDDAAARALAVDERDLQFWAFDDAWQRIRTIDLDLANHIITATSTRPSYVAVTIPEPSTAALLAAAAGALMLRRRRRRSPGFRSRIPSTAA